MIFHSKPSWSLTYEPVCLLPFLNFSCICNQKRTGVQLHCNHVEFESCCSFSGICQRFSIHSIYIFLCCHVRVTFFARSCALDKKYFHFFQLQMKSKPHSLYLSWRGCVIGRLCDIRLYFSTLCYVHGINLIVSLQCVSAYVCVCEYATEYKFWIS